MATKLAPKNFKADADFAQAMHGPDAAKKSGFTAVLGKNKEAHSTAIEGYFKHWDNINSETQTQEDKDARLGDYSSLTRHFYDLATDFYEYGWGTSFHFSRYYKGEGFKQAGARHEHFLAHQMGIKAGMKVLDVGCGVGGPGREICRFTDCSIVGLNNNDYQIQKANHYAKTMKLDDKLSYVKGDFMQMDFPDNSFDAVYAIEATVHAPELEGVYKEIFRVLKPGGTFGVYEWVMTDKFDAEDAHHREVAYGIEIGNGIPKMVKNDVCEKALESAGFKVTYQKDLADCGDDIPWYYPLTGEWKYIQTFGDLFTFLRSSRIGRMVTMEATGLLETLKIAPKGSKKVTLALEDAAVNLVEGGRLGIFTPMFLYVSKKPE